MDNQSISHTRRNRTYHIVLIPKYRKKILYSKIRLELIDLFRRLCEMNKVQLLGGAVCIDLFICILQSYQNFRYQKLLRI